MNARILRSALAATFLSGASSLASAGPPDSQNSTVPPYVYLVGTTGTGEPDAFGRITVVVRDAFNNPIAGATVTVDFSGCCDINLCDAGVGHSCTARTVSGLADLGGRFSFTAMGAARDPGNLTPPAQYGGCGSHGIHVYANSGTGNVELLGPNGFSPTAVALDLNGAAGGSNGTTGSDVGALIQLFGSVALGSPYRGRGDIDADGAISGADVAALITHFGRLSLIGGQGCPGALCAQAGCAPSFHGAGARRP